MVGVAPQIPCVLHEHEFAAKLLLKEQSSVAGSELHFAFRDDYRELDVAAASLVVCDSARSPRVREDRVLSGSSG